MHDSKQISHKWRFLNWPNSCWIVPIHIELSQHMHELSQFMTFSCDKNITNKKFEWQNRWQGWRAKIQILHKWHLPRFNMSTSEITHSKFQSTTMSALVLVPSVSNSAAFGMTSGTVCPWSFQIQLNCWPRAPTPGRHILDLTPHDSWRMCIILVKVK